MQVRSVEISKHYKILILSIDEKEESKGLFFFCCISTVNEHIVDVFRAEILQKVICRIIFLKKFNNSPVLIRE